MLEQAEPTAGLAVRKASACLGHPFWEEGQKPLQISHLSQVCTCGAQEAPKRTEARRHLSLSEENIGQEQVLPPSTHGPSALSSPPLTLACPSQWTRGLQGKTQPYLVLSQ